MTISERKELLEVYEILGRLLEQAEAKPVYTGAIEPGMRFLWAATGEPLVVERVVDRSPMERRVFSMAQARLGREAKLVYHDESEFRESVVLSQ